MLTQAREELEAFDDALTRSLAGSNYYPDQGAMAAYARATRTYLPLEGDAYLAFADTIEYKKKYRNLTPEQRCSLILSEWNTAHPGRTIEDPFASDAY